MSSTKLKDMEVHIGTEVRTSADLSSKGEIILHVAADEELSFEDDKRILRKLDFCLLPVLTFSYLLQFLDKGAMSYTAILGLREDLHLVGQEYAWASSMFYVGYLVASYPASVLLIKLPLGKFLGATVILWATMLMVTAGTRNAAGLWATRFFLGFLESAVAPGFSIITSLYYKRSEQPLRHGAWFMGNVASGIFGGVLSYSLGHIRSIAPWKAVFLVFGSVTFAWGIAVYFLLPDAPSTAWFLSKEDRTKAVLRVKGNMTGMKSHKWKPYQMVEALTDPKTWFIVLFQLSMNIPNGGITSFGTIVIKGLGFNTFNTLLVQMISIAFQGTFVILSTVGSTYLPDTRTIFMAFNVVCALVGTVMMRSMPKTHIWARFMGYCLLVAFSANFPMVLVMTSANTGGFTKKTTVNALVFIAYCAGNIIGPQLFFASEAPRYDSGFIAMLVCFSFGFFMILVLRFYLIRENKRRDKTLVEGGRSDARLDDESHAEVNQLDKTDRELKDLFRYLY